MERARQTSVSRKCTENIVHLPEAISVQLYLNSVCYSRSDSRKAGAGAGWTGGTLLLMAAPEETEETEERGREGEEEPELGLSSQATMATKRMDRADSQVTFKHTLTALKAQLKMMSNRPNTHSIRSRDDGLPRY